MTEDQAGVLLYQEALQYYIVLQAVVEDLPTKEVETLEELGVVQVVLLEVGHMIQVIALSQ
jgi:hypothetical protein